MSKTSRVEFWDWPPEPKRSRRPRIERVEILPPRQPERTVRVDIHHHRRSIITPQMVTIGALIVLAIILLRSPAAMLMFAALVPSFVWLALGVIVAVLAIVA